MTMHDQTPQDFRQYETTIERKLTFRNSTYGGLKAFIRAHKRRTGIDLTNSAAVDFLLRERLARELHPAAFGELLKLSRPSGKQALHATPSGDPEEALERALAGAVSPVPATEASTPVRSSRVVSIDVRVGGRRSFVRRGAA